MISDEGKEKSSVLTFASATLQSTRIVPLATNLAAKDKVASWNHKREIRD